MKKIIIAIDGPAGSGKSTTARELATRLNYLYIDTGAMYRTVTYMALKNGCENNPVEVIDRLKHSVIGLNYQDGVTYVSFDGVDVTEELRTKEVNALVSTISKIKEVRENLVERQKKMGLSGGVVMEGRDIGTAVFPDAGLKIFLIADIQTRAERRLLEINSKGKVESFNDIKQNLEYRDNIDSSREVDPLKCAKDAYQLDTTELTIKEQVDYIYNLAIQKLNQ